MFLYTKCDIIGLNKSDGVPSIPAALRLVALYSGKGSASREKMWRQSPI